MSKKAVSYLSIASLMVDELVCHTPYSIAAVVASLFVGSLLSLLGNPEGLAANGKTLFHILHFAHIIFASSSVVIAFRRFSSSFWGAVILGIVVPSIFCTLSDIILPQWGGALSGLDVELHLCFKSHLTSVIPFLAVGIINGFLLSLSKKSASRSAILSHATHSYLSALASLLYLASYGSGSLWTNVGSLFSLLLISVIVPCSISDIVVPILFASKLNPREMHHAHECDA